MRPPNTSSAWPTSSIPRLLRSSRPTICAAWLSRPRQSATRITWDAVEQVHGDYDDAFLGELRGLLDLLHEHHLLAVLDMHQDAWSEYIGSDGAPQWAGPQCNVPPSLSLGSTTGVWMAQYGSPDVEAAWSNFWNDGFGPADTFCRYRSRRPSWTCGATSPRFLAFFFAGGLGCWDTTS